MRKVPSCIGIGLFTAGLCLLISCFVPNMIIICFQAVLLIVAGFFLIKG